MISRLVERGRSSAFRVTAVQAGLTVIHHHHGGGAAFRAKLRTFRKMRLGDAKLRLIAAELIIQVKKGVTIDWTLRESARAKFKVMVKRILNK